MHSHHKALKAMGRVPRFCLREEEKHSPFKHLRAVPIPLPTPPFQLSGSKVAQPKDADVWHRGWADA